MKKQLFFLILVTSIIFSHQSLIGGTVRLQYGNQQVIDCVFTGWPYCYGSEEAGTIRYVGGGDVWGRYYCKIPLTYFPDSSTVVSRAVLKVFLLDQTFYQNSFQLTINRLAQPMIDSYRTSVGGIIAPTYFDTPTYDTVSVSGSYSGWIEFDITDLVRGWISKEFPNDGFLIRMLDQTYASTGIYESLCSDATKRPVLEISGPTLPDTLITDVQQPIDGRWIQTNSRGNAIVTSLTSQGSALYAALYSGHGSIDSSTDAGNTWMSATLYPSVPITSFAIHNTTIICGTQSNGLWRSTDRGYLWDEIQGIPLGVNWSALHFAQNRFFAAFPGGVFVSSDEGITWNLTLTDTVNYHMPNGFAFDGTNNYVSTMRGVYRSTDQGSSWTATNVGLTDTNLTCVEYNETYVVVGTTSGNVFISSDNGLNWSEADNGLPNAVSITALLVVGAHLFAGTSDGGLYLTRNYGQSWRLDTTSLGGGRVSAFTSDGTYLFAGIWGGTGGVWRCPLDQLTYVKHDQFQSTPWKSILQQNYPNPFNPSTIISYQLPSQCYTTLKIFDIVGREVATLVNEIQEAGNNSVEFNTKYLPSGIYFYRLQAGKYTETKKLLILK